MAGRPRVDITSEANIVLSGSSPKKMIGKTATTTASCTDHLSVGAERSVRAHAAAAIT